MLYPVTSSTLITIGTSMLIAGACIFLVLNALLSTIPFSISVPQNEALPVIALIVANSISVVSSYSIHGELESTAIAAVIITTFSCGIIIYLFGLLKLGSLVRFIPFTVIAGFLGGIGILLVIGGIQTSLPQGKTITDIVTHWQFQDLLFLLPSLSFAIAIIIGDKKFKHPFVMPAISLIAIIIFFVVIELMSIPIASLRKNGLLTNEISLNSLYLQLSNLAFYKVQWEGILNQYGNIIIAAMVSIFALLFNETSIEVATKTQVNFNHNLKITGISNLIASGVGSSVGYPTFSLSILNNKLNGSTRIPAILTCLILISILFFFPIIIGYIPKFILSGFLIYLGVIVFEEWVIKTYAQLPISEYILILSIIICITIFGIFNGVIFGTLCATIIFLIKYSRISPIKYLFTGDVIQSHVDRSFKEMIFLRENGNKILFVKLQNYIFFGTANNLVTRLHEKLKHSHYNIRYLILDFRFVTGIDASAILSLQKLKFLVESDNCILIFCHSHEAIKTQLIQAELIPRKIIVYEYFKNSNDAIEWCENEILKNTGLLNKKNISLLESLNIFCDLKEIDDVANKLNKYFQKIIVQTGQVLHEQGDEANELFYIESGELTAIIRVSNNHTIPLRTLTAGSIVGEIGFYLKELRSATVIAKTDCVVHVLHHDAFLSMQEIDPMLANCVNLYVLKIVTERLAFANNQISLLNL
jgi:SulP family sulfate permease